MYYFRASFSSGNLNSLCRGKIRISIETLVIATEKGVFKMYFCDRHPFYLFFGYLTLCFVIAMERGNLFLERLVYSLRSKECLENDHFWVLNF